MEQELDTRLKAMEKKIDDMNNVVSKMHRSQRNARNRKMLYWAVIIVLSIISYYSIKPYLTELKNAYGVGEESTSNYADLLKSINE